MNNNFGGSTSTQWFCVYHSWSNLNLKMIGFEERGNPDYSEKNIPEENSNSTRNQVDEEQLCGCATSNKSLFIIYKQC